jgi:hypothetical protein
MSNTNAYGTYTADSAKEVENKDEKKGSKFAISFESTRQGITYNGYIYYFTKEEGVEINLGNINDYHPNVTKKLGNIYIVAYNKTGKKFDYYKLKDDLTTTLKQQLDSQYLKKYKQCVIVNIGVLNTSKFTYIFLKNTERIDDEKSDAPAPGSEFLTYTGKSGPDDNITDIVDSLFTNLETYNNERDKRIPSETNEMSAAGGGKRKYKADVNQKSLKKFSTIIKKLLNINLNIKLAAKPKAKPATKPTAKPKAKPTAKPKAKPKAKPTAKPKAKPAAKPKAKPTAKPKAKPAAKPVAKK